MKTTADDWKWWRIRVAMSAINERPAMPQRTDAQLELGLGVAAVDDSAGDEQGDSAAI